MSNDTVQQAINWWAAGDTPVHADSNVAYLVDAHSTWLTMCSSFLMAKKYVYVAAWGMTPLMQLVRGTDQRAGPDGTPEQEALVADLRAQGLQEPEIDFWCSHELTVQAVLGYAVRKGVEAKVLLWSSSEEFSHLDPKGAKEQLTQVGVTCILDDSARGPRHHPIESLHQKIAVVDGTTAFVGGIDMVIGEKGDFDRWDTHLHHFVSPLRSNTEDPTPHNWHDAHALIEGPAAADIERNFRERWNDVVQRHHWSSQLLVPDHPLPPPLDRQWESPSLVQVARTIPTRTYQFAPKGGIQGIAQQYANALHHTEQFVYLENQYFWTHAYYTKFGLGNKVGLRGTDSPDMERNISELADVLERGATVAMVLPDHPNVGRSYTDAGLARLREKAPVATDTGRIQTFCLAVSRQTERGEAEYRPIYVHAKVAIVDDLWSTVGSGNLNNRGMRDDTEMNVATLNAELARGVRMLLWAEHVGLIDEDSKLSIARHLGHQQQGSALEKHATEQLQSLDEALGNPVEGLNLLVERSQDNLRRFQAKQPLVGHLLPYLTFAEAKQQGLRCTKEQGWVEVAQQ